MAEKNDPLLAWLKSARGEYQGRKTAAEKQVARWEYATKQDRALEPGHLEYYDVAPGRKLSKLPASPKTGTMAYGLDEAGRTIVERMYSGPARYCESFYAWTKEGVEWVSYDLERRPLSVARATFDREGQMVALRARSSDGADDKRFHYLSGGRVRVENSYIGSDGRPGQGEFTVKMRTGTEKETPLAEALPPLEKKLLDEIPKRVRALKLKEPAYSLIIAFAGKGNDLFPPTLGIGLERERQAILANAELKPAEVLWDPADYDLYMAPKLRLDDLKPLAAQVNRAIERRQAWSIGYQSYQRLAASLRTLDWRRLLPTTDDFVLIAVDYDDTGLMRALREAAGAKTFATWKKKKWVR